MAYPPAKLNLRSLITSFLIIMASCLYIRAHDPVYYFDNDTQTIGNVEIVTLGPGRYKRDVTPAPIRNETQLPTPVNVTANASTNSTANNTKNATEGGNIAAVTQIPLLGQNGTGILRVNLTGNLPKVSEPIPADEDFTDMFKETPELIKAEQNFLNLTYDNHEFYNSSFIGNKIFFDEYWANITKPTAERHAVLSNSHRRATTIKLSFDFPFYGHFLNNITVATGGFIYTGDHVHNWLAATQYIAPLMANFDTTLTNDSIIKQSDDGEKFTVFWESVTLQEDPSKKFSFAVSLYKNGDIVFAYKDIPIPVQAINDDEHPVKVGISDAYLTDRIIFYIRRKTIYEYHRVSFKSHNITNNTILKLTALPTCLQYKTCHACVNHDPTLNCSWCSQIQKCSSGTDRNKQDWLLRHCDKSMVNKDIGCPAYPENTEKDIVYSEHDMSIYDEGVIKKGPDDRVVFPTRKPHNPPTVPTPVHATSEPAESHSVGAVVAVFMILTILCGVGAWGFYAFRNPNTASGQFLIKYRPSQWNWRRGEARYTAATIHM